MSAPTPSGRALLAFEEQSAVPQEPITLQPELSAGYQVRRCHRRFDRLLHAFLARHDLKSGFWYYLRILWIRDGVTQKYLSDMTNTAENTTAALINAMAAEGLVNRDRNPDDRRKFRISLTDRGKALEDEVLGYATRLNEIAQKGIDQAEIDICLSVLDRMSANLAEAFEQQGIAPTAP